MNAEDAIEQHRLVFCCMSRRNDRDDIKRLLIDWIPAALSLTLSRKRERGRLLFSPLGESSWREGMQ